MTGSDSWVQLHLCNKLGDCCTSQQIREIQSPNFKFVWVTPSEPCGNLVLDRFDPMGGGQSFEIENVGPDGTSMDFLAIRLAGSVSLRCEDPNGANGEIVLSDGQEKRVVLECRTQFVFA